MEVHLKITASHVYCSKINLIHLPHEKSEIKSGKYPVLFSMKVVSGCASRTTLNSW